MTLSDFQLKYNQTVRFGVVYGAHSIYDSLHRWKKRKKKSKKKLMARFQCDQAKFSKDVENMNCVREGKRAIT